MLILIGTVPTAYALNHAVSPMQMQEFIAASEQAGQILNRHVDDTGVLGSDPRGEVTAYIRTKQLQPDTVLALSNLVESVNREVVLYKEFKSVPAQDQTNIRNDMYLTSEALRLMVKNHNPGFTAGETATLNNYKSKLDKATRFIPDWVKVAVALALGLGTMIGWKRVVVTVGEKIGKEQLTYAEGASAGRTSSVPEWPAPCRPTAAACACPRSAISPPAGCSRCPPPHCSPAYSTWCSATCPDASPRACAILLSNNLFCADAAGCASTI
jgi:PiT family inorganic phosphate transporter